MSLRKRKNILYLRIGESYFYSLLRRNATSEQVVKNSLRLIWVRVEIQG